MPQIPAHPLLIPDRHKPRNIVPNPHPWALGLISMLSLCISGVVFHTSNFLPPSLVLFTTQSHVTSSPSPLLWELGDVGLLVRTITTLYDNCSIAWVKSDVLTNKILISNLISHFLKASKAWVDFSNINEHSPLRLIFGRSLKRSAYSIIIPIRARRLQWSMDVFSEAWRTIVEGVTIITIMTIYSRSIVEKDEWPLLKVLLPITVMDLIGHWYFRTSLYGM